MRKAFFVFLIALACNISRYVLVHADSTRKPEVAGRNSGYKYQAELHGQLDDTEVPRGSFENSERSNEPVGKWRNNGEALEPKWRDGDSIPLLPFSHYRSYARDDVDDVEQENPHETNQRPYKYRYSLNQPSRPDDSLNKRVAPLDNHETTYRENDNLDEEYIHKRYRPSKNPNIAQLRSTTLYVGGMAESSENDGRKRNHNIIGDSLDNREANSARYREAFQARPNEYDHELDDEEYLKPRPRKRRPPSYESVLTTEESEYEEFKDSSQSSSQLGRTENLPVTQSPNKQRTQHEGRNSENALELKSLLKMQQKEGSSLSEILQRRNLTLSDLLKGKADVINALKSRIADESDEYIEEMSRVMSNSLMKLSATASPSWRSTQQLSTTSADITMKTIATSNTLHDTVSSTTIANEVTKNYQVSFNDTNNITEESTDIENRTHAMPVHDISWTKVTTPLSISTVITTSTSLPSAMNSMEYFLNDESNVGLTSDRGLKLENIDEDEIMEFSDFTDFKKGKSSASPVWLTDEKIVGQSMNETEESRDIGSTLSIEQILNPTERIELTKDCTTDQDDDIVDNNNRATQDDPQSVSNNESPAEDYNAFMETEYQNDSPIDIDEEQSTVRADSNMNKNNTNNIINIPLEKKKQDVSSMYDKNHSTEYHQVNQSKDTVEEKYYDHALKNHRRTNSRRYEEVVSEIEPEARAEIFELFASGSAGKRLERLLKSRNMSVEELIALRQRGSSKVHLTEVSRLKVPKPKNLQLLDTITSESNSRGNEDIIPLLPTSNFNERLSEDMRKEDEKQKSEESMSQFKQDIISYLHDPFFDKDAENMSMSRLLELVERDRNASREAAFSDNDTRNFNKYSELENSRREAQIVDLLTTFSSLPIAKEVQRQFAASEHGQIAETNLSPENKNASVILINETEKTIRSNNSSSQFHAGYIEEIVREEPNIIDIRTVYDESISSTNGNNAGEEKKTLLKVKPSIIASGAILGVTIVVFFAIFIVCRIRQKQKYIYRNTFSRAVFQGPVSAARKLSNSSSLSTVMVNVVATSTAKRPEKIETQETMEELNNKNDIDNDSLDANDSWETIPDYAK